MPLNQPPYNNTYNNSSTPTTQDVGALVAFATNTGVPAQSVCWQQYETELRLLVQAAEPSITRDVALATHQQHGNPGALINYIIAYNDSKQHNPEQIRAWYQRALELTL